MRMGSPVPEDEKQYLQGGNPLEGVRFLVSHVLWPAYRISGGNHWRSCGLTRRELKLLCHIVLYINI